MPDETANDRIAKVDNAEAWTEFCDLLKKAGEVVLRDDLARSSFDPRIRQQCRQGRLETRRQQGDRIIERRRLGLRLVQFNRQSHELMVFVDEFDDRPFVQFA